MLPLSYSLLCGRERVRTEPRSALEERWRRDGILPLPRLVSAGTAAAYLSARQEPDLMAATTGALLARVLEEVSGEPLAADLTAPGDGDSPDWHADAALPCGPVSLRASLWLVLARPDQDRPWSLEHAPQSHRLGPYDHAREELERRRRGLDEPHGELVLRLAAQAVRGWDWKPRTWVGHPGDALLWHPDLLHREGPSPPESLVVRYYPTVGVAGARKSWHGGWFFRRGS